jgi:hypothetical protein
MRYETNLVTGEVTEHEDAPVIVPSLEKLKSDLRTKVNDKRNWYEVAGFPFIALLPLTMPLLKTHHLASNGQLQTILSLL